MVPDPKKTVQKIMLKLPYVLELFHSLQSKKQLLQEAVILGDGDTILMVGYIFPSTIMSTKISPNKVKFLFYKYYLDDTILYLNKVSFVWCLTLIKVKSARNLLAGGS